MSDHSSNENYLPIEIKQQIRNIFRDIPRGKDIRHYICGEVKPDKKSSKIFISRQIGGEIFIRGYIPKNNSLGLSYEEVENLQNDILDHLESVGTLDDCNTYTGDENYQDWVLELIQTEES